MNPKKLIQARKARGYSLRQLADRVGVSAMVLSKYERGLSKPRAKNLARLLDALNVDEVFLKGHADVTLKEIEYRTLRGQALPELHLERIEADISEQVEVRLGCEQLIPDIGPGKLSVPPLPGLISDLEQLENVAQEVRDSWGLGTAPIKNMMAVLEEHGFRVFTTEIDGGDRFDGFSALFGDMPIIVLGSGWHGDRQRFTLAHELGHYLIRARLSETLDEEIACHRFAAAFLVPRLEALNAMGAPREGILSTYELYMLKHQWGLSMQAWVFRALHLGVINKFQKAEQWRKVKGHRGFKEEPGLQYSAETNYQLNTAIARALIAKKIDRNQAARLMHVAVDSLEQLLTLGK